MRKQAPSSVPERPSRFRLSWNATRERLAGSAMVQRGWSFYQAQSPRDQRALILLGLLLLLLWIGFGVLWPLQQSAADARQTWLQSSEDLAWMQAHRHQLADAGQTRRQDGQSLLSLVTQTAGDHGLTVRRFDPMAGNGVSLSLDQVEFDRAVVWLEELIRAGVRVDEFSASRGEQPGIVDLRVVLRG